MVAGSRTACTCEEDETMVDPTAGSTEITQDDKTMAMLACLLVIVSYFVGPLIIYLIKKDQSKFVAYHAMQAMFLGIAAFVLTFLFGIGWILGIIFGILSGLAANKGEWYEIPVIGKLAKQQVGIPA